MLHFVNDHKPTQRLQREGRLIQAPEITRVLQIEVRHGPLFGGHLLRKRGLAHLPSPKQCDYGVVCQLSPEVGHVGVTGYQHI